MPENQLLCARQGSLVDAILDAAAHSTITPESALRLVFLIRKAGERGYVWWKRTSLALHWGVHKTTVTRDYEQWSALGFVKLRPNPLKASAKLVTFSWCKVWDDAIWEDLEKVASMLPELTESFGPKSRKGCMSATKKRRTDATSSSAPTITENIKGKNTNKQQAAAGLHDRDSQGGVPRKPPGDPDPQKPHQSASPSIPAEEAVEGFSEMRTLLARHHVRFRPGQIQELIEAGRAQGLTVEGVLAFVEDKLVQKRDQNDPVFSAKLLINAISDDADLHRWGVKRHRCSSFFNQPSNRSEPPFTVAELRTHLSDRAETLRTISGCQEIAAELDLLATDSESHLHDLEALEQHLTTFEDRVVAVALAQMAEADLRQMRREVASKLEPYRKKMTTQQWGMLERQYREQWLFESNGIPRLSLFYLDITRVAA